MLSVSVVVPAHNEEQLLAACLRSLREQDYGGRVELIVVDNASTDRTAEIANACGAIVVSEPKRHYCLALIGGFAMAQGDIIACTDADTRVPPGWISRLAREYEEHPDVVAVGGGVQYEQPNLKGWLVARFLVPAFSWLDRRNRKGPHLWGANMSVRRSTFLEVGGWNPSYSLQADSELSQRLRNAGRVVLLENLKVRTSSRRWNQALFFNLFLYISNWIWLKALNRPLWRDFPVVRTIAKTPRRAVRAALGAGILLVVLAGIVASALVPRSNAFGRTYWHADTREKVLALTFDDGPNEPYTSEVLDILKRENVHATFFLVGANVRRFPAAAGRIAREGHIVGNHSDTHPIRFALEPIAVLRREVANAEETIHNATGEFPKLFRPPQGLRSPWLMQVLESDSLIAVTWDDTPKDWDPEPSAVLIDRTVRGAHPGSIILLHDGMNTDHGANQSATVAALPNIIRELRAEGYRFLTVPELLNCAATLPAWPAQRQDSMRLGLRAAARAVR